MLWGRQIGCSVSPSNPPSPCWYDNCQKHSGVYNGDVIIPTPTPADQSGTLSRQGIRRLTTSRPWEIRWHGSYLQGDGDRSLPASKPSHERRR